jgi:hypothetical protein
MPRVQSQIAMTAAILVVSCSVAASARASLAYGIDGNGAIYRFDIGAPTATFQFLHLLPPGNGGWEGLEFDGAGNLWAMTYSRSFDRVDPATGIGTPIGNVQMPPNFSGFTKDLSFNPATGQMEILAWGNAVVGGGSNTIYALNTSTLAATLIGGVSPATTPICFGMATDAGGRRSILEPHAGRVYDLLGPAGLDATPRPVTAGYTRNAIAIDRFGDGSMYVTTGNMLRRVGSDGSALDVGLLGTYPDLSLSDIAIIPSPAGAAVLTVLPVTALRRRRVPVRPQRR